MLRNLSSLTHSRCDLRFTTDSAQRHEADASRLSLELEQLKIKTATLEASLHQCQAERDALSVKRWSFRWFLLQSKSDIVHSTGFDKGQLEQFMAFLLR